MTIGHIVLYVNHLAFLGRSLLLSRSVGHPMAAEWNLKLSTGIRFFWRAPSRRPVSKGPHFSFFLFFSRGPLLDWFTQIMLYSHWSTQTWRSTNACVPATDEAVVCTLIEPSNAGAY